MVVEASHSGSGGNSINVASKQSQASNCQSAGGNSPITASCINAQSSENTNSGGIIVNGGGSGSGSGYSGSGGNSINVASKQSQASNCQSAGGNSPITLSCINAQSSENTNSGGIIVNGGSGSGSGHSGHGHHGHSGSSINVASQQSQASNCQSAGGNSPITPSCINAQSSHNTNSGGGIIPNA